jgi:methenyltetrahydrofolate cyclohydrolase
MTNTQTFLKVLDPKDTSVGGGSAAALAGAMAGALIAMVCQLSSKTSASANSDILSAVDAETQALSQQLLEGGQADTLAFQGVRNAYKLPKGTEGERQVRNQAVQAAWLEAAQVPLDNATRCLRVARRGAEVQERISPAVRSDLNCALLLAQAGVLGCLENVATNLASIKDPAQVSQLAQTADSVRAQLAALPAVPSIEASRPPSRGEAKTQ